MSSRAYIHGTSEREQRRLVEQADLLGDNLELHLGERLPEIGCGVGAVLGHLAGQGDTHPSLIRMGI
jgi:cyclopropane fatty-acyl-phospholipid synthase-like methyltransferase